MTRTLTPLVLLVPLLVFSDHRDIVGRPISPPVFSIAFVIALLATVWGQDRCRVRWCNAIPMSLLTAVMAVVAPPPIACVAVAGTLALLLSPFAGRDLARVGCSTVVASLVYWLLPIPLLRNDPPEAIGHIVAAILKALGATAIGTEQGFAFKTESTGTIEVSVGWLALGVREGLAFAAGALALVRQPAAHAGRLLAATSLVLAAACAFRLLCIAIVVAESGHADVVVDPWWRSFGFVAPGIVTLLLQRRRPVDPAPARAESWPRNAVTAVAVTMIGVATWAPGPTKWESGGIAIAEGHSDWERVDLGLNRVVYGTRSVYNYSEWMRAIERRFGKVHRLPLSFGASDLRGVRVLIVKTPTRHFTATQASAVDNFVRQGGGLYLVGDHTDVFGMSQILNALACRYGIQFRSDSVFEHDYQGGQVTDPETLPPHPILTAMRPMHWMTSCSLALDGPAQPLLWIQNGYADAARHGKFTGFGNELHTPDERAGVLAQAAYADVGSGRVLAFADSTVFSSFSVFLPGVREMALAGIDWLHQRERAPGWRPVLIMLGIAHLLLLRAWKHWTPGRTASGIGGVAFALMIANARCEQVMESFETAMRGQEVMFDSVHSAGRLPIWHQSHSYYRDEFMALFTYHQRCGLIPRVALCDDELFVGRSLVMIWPKKPLPTGWHERAREFVEGGGTLFVYEDRVAAGSAANEILEAYGLQMTEHQQWRGVEEGWEPESDERLLLSHSTRVLGGEVVLRDTEGVPIMAVARYGKGKVVAVGIAEDLGTATLGEPDGPVDRKQRQLVPIVYRIIEEG